MRRYIWGPSWRWHRGQCRGQHVHAAKRQGAVSICVISLQLAVLTKDDKVLKFRARRCVCMFALIVIEVLTFQALAQTGDIDKGRMLAERLCSVCHALQSNKGHDYQGHYVPTFRQIASTPHYSIVRLPRIMAVPPHREMPKLSLKLDEINDIATYIGSLRK